MASRQNGEEAEMRLPPLVDLTCKQVTEVVGDYLASPGMARTDRARFEQHLHACTWCMDYLHQLEQGRRAASALRSSRSGPLVSSESDPSELPEAALVALFSRWSREREPPRAGVVPELSRAVPERRAGPHRSARRTETVRFGFKFLMEGAVGPVSLFRWPTPSPDRPGAWVVAEGAVEPCLVGIHACTTRHLSSWLHDSLWLVELDGEQRQSVGSFVSARGRLLREVEGWREGGAARFAQAAYDHAVALAAAETPKRRALAEPCLRSSAYHIPRGSTALAAFCAAMSVARAWGFTGFDQAGYDAERRWQSSWIAQDLQLDAVLNESALL